MRHMNSPIGSSLVKSAVSAAILLALASSSWLGCGDDEEPRDSIQAPDGVCYPEVEHSAVISFPVLIQFPPPIYPEEARKQGHEGRVTLYVFVGEDGRPCRLGVRESPGFPELDAAAIESVRGATFQPAMCADGYPCVAEVLIPMTFTLH